MAGGVILPRIASITIELLEEKNGFSLLNDQRMMLYEAEKDLAIGKITPDAYLDQLCSVIGGLDTRDNLFIELMKLIKVDSGPLSTAIDLKQTSQIYLFSDYPRAWLQAIHNNFHIMSHFTSQNVVYSAELHLSDDLYSVFDILVAEGSIEPGASLWLDAYPLRTSAAIRRGIDAIIYVDERRLRRELNLRKLLPTGIKGDN